MKILDVGRVAVLGASAVALSLATAHAQPLDRDPASYHILGRTEVRLKDFHLVTQGPGCNIGVNNALGLLRNTDSGFFAAAGTQIVADDCAASGGQVAQCFCNFGGVQFNPACQPWNPVPILADETDATFIAACNAAMPGGDFPQPCTAGAQKIVVDKDEDCDPIGVDTQLGNGQCDLPPGDYGLIDVNRKGALNLNGGVYNAQEYHADRDAILTIKNPSTLNVCGPEDLRFGDQGATISACGLFRVNYASTGQVNLGVRKIGDISMHVCAPFGEINLRRNNSIEGNYFSNTVASDFSNTGKCCPAGLCGCFDVVDPTSVQVGDDLTLTGGCDLQNITQVLVCGQNCPITFQDASTIVCTVPNPGVGLPTACEVVGVTGSGNFVSNQAVTINP